MKAERVGEGHIALEQLGTSWHCVLQVWRLEEKGGADQLGPGERPL